MYSENPKLKKVFLKNLIRRVLKKQEIPIGKVPGCLQNGYILVKFISALACVNFKKYIKSPTSKKEILMNFEAIFTILSTDGFDTSVWDINSLITGDLRLIENFALAVTTYFLSGHTAAEDGLIAWSKDYTEDPIVQFGQPEDNKIKVKLILTKFLSLNFSNNYSFVDLISIANTKKGIPSLLPKAFEANKEEYEKELSDIFGRPTEGIGRVYLEYVKLKQTNKPVFKEEDFKEMPDSKSTHKHHNKSNHDENNTKENKEKKSRQSMELERLKKQKELLEAKVALKEQKQKLHELNQSEESKLKEEEKEKEKEETEKKEKKMEVITGKNITELMKIVAQAKEDDEKRSLVFKTESNFFMSFLVDSSLKTGNHLKDIQVLIYGPVTPAMARPPAKDERRPPVSYEAATKVEDLNNGKYLIVHKFIRTGLFYIKTVMWGREPAISPVFLYIGDTGGVWLRPSGNSVKEINNALLDTGKHVMDAETLEKHRAGLLEMMAKYSMTLSRKAFKIKNERILNIVTTESKDLEERQVKEMKRIKRILQHLKDDQKNEAPGCCTKNELEDASDAIEELIKKRKQVFLDIFKKVVSNGFTFQSVPSNKIFSPKPQRLKVAGFETGFLKLQVDSNKHNMNKSTTKVEFVEKEGKIKIEIEKKIYNLRSSSEEVSKYFTKGLQLLSTI
eukprot:GAHX01000089.1.p1 GENE.GAHX01000089.1~~GAHX01000089.1.p1  ORF type:complete len:677 (+),score=198.93 GAHX01000089.1:63-2093(+)